MCVFENSKMALYDDGLVSVVQHSPTKLTQAEAGFVKPPLYVSKSIEPDRFCCGNCVRYIKKTRQCHAVEGDVGDIESLDCCNIFLSLETLKGNPQDGERALLSDQQKDVKLYVSSGALSSQDVSAVLNGVARIQVNQEVVIHKLKTVELEEQPRYSEDDRKVVKHKKRKSKKKSSCIII